LILGIEDDLNNWWKSKFLPVPPYLFWPNDEPVKLTLTYVPLNPPQPGNFGTATLAWSGSANGYDTDSPLVWTVDSQVGTSLSVTCKTVSLFQFLHFFGQITVEFDNITLDGQQIICDFDVSVNSQEFGFGEFYETSIYSAYVNGLTTLPNGFVFSANITFDSENSKFDLNRAFCEVHIESVRQTQIHWPWNNGQLPT